MSTLKLETHDTLVYNMLDVLYPDHKGNHVNPFDVQNKDTVECIMAHLSFQVRYHEAQTRHAMRDANTAKTKKLQHEMTLEHFKTRHIMFKNLHDILLNYYSKQGLIDFDEVWG